MENISNFLTAAETYGCHRGDLFQSVYLQDGQNMPAVIGGIHALGRRVRINITFFIRTTCLKIKNILRIMFLIDRI